MSEVIKPCPVCGCLDHLRIEARTARNGKSREFRMACPDCRRVSAWTTSPDKAVHYWNYIKKEERE